MNKTMTIDMQQQKICDTCKKPIAADQSTVTRADGSVHHPKCYAEALSKPYAKKYKGRRTQN